MKVVAVLGATGGAGATTLVSHLASALVMQQRHALAVDLCPENQLRLHFGMQLDDARGFARQLVEGQDWNAAAYRDASGVDFLPFGQMTDEASLRRLMSWLDDNPRWFAHQLQRLHLPEDTVVVCDCPRGLWSLRNQVLASADLALLVCAPDTLSYLQVKNICSEQDQSSLPTLVVLNGFDASRRLDRDVTVLLRARHGDILSPVVVHRDEAVREALACKQSVFGFAPSSQAAYDLAALATWTLARVHQPEQAHDGAW